MIKLDVQDKEVPGSWFQREVNVIDKLGRGGMIHARDGMIHSSASAILSQTCCTTPKPSERSCNEL